MGGLHRGWDNRTADQWLEQAARFQKMASRFDLHSRLHASFAALARDAGKRAKQSSMACDLDYLRMRAAHEQTAGGNAADIRVRRVHLEMAKRYQALIRATETAAAADLRRVS